MARLRSLVPMATVLLVLASIVCHSSGQIQNCGQWCEQYTQWMCNLYCGWSGCGSSCLYAVQVNTYSQRCFGWCGSRATTTTTTTTPPPPTQASCGVSYVGRIVGGTQAEECEFPWAVVVHVGGNLCGGSILDSNTVLTAGHCVYSMSEGVVPANVISVKYGSSSQKKMKTAHVIKIDLHPDFVLRYYDYDVAVLTLDRNLLFDICTQPVCIPPVDADPLATEGCLAVGWGALDFNVRRAQDQLQKVALPIVPLAQCQAAYNTALNNYRQVTDIKICAGDLKNGGIDSCLGDSGGPLLCYSNGAYSVFGLVSFGSGCARPGYPGVYARVTESNINAWIRSKI